MSMPVGFDQIRPRKGFGDIRFGSTKQECRTLLGTPPAKAELLEDDYKAFRLIYGHDGRLRRARFYGSLGADPLVGDQRVLSRPCSSSS